MSNFTLMPWAPSQWTDSLGNILEFGIIRFYQAGTLIPKTTYKKADGSEENTDPLVLDSSARARVWLINGEAYDIVVHNKNDEFEYSILDVVVNGGTGGGGTTTLFQDSSTVTWSTVTVGSNVYNIATVVPGGVLDYKVKADGTEGDEPGYLVAKLTDKAGATFDIDDDGIKRVVIPLQDYLNKGSGGTVTGPTTIQNLTVSTFNMGAGSAGMLVVGVDGAVTRAPIPEDLCKIKAGSGDIAGYYVDKIQPGAGIQFNETVDGVNGVVLHISTTDDGELTAPLDEVISGDGAGGIKSSPLFTASGGAVAAETLRANSTAVAIMAPNGSIEAKGVASVDQSTWGGAGFAFFGLKDHNPPTNDGTISGLMVGEYTADLYANNGGSASIGTGASRLAVYSAQAAIDVPFNGPAFNPSDCLVLTGASYASTFHAVFAFVGTGTSFAAPAGSSLNTGLRLSNSSAVGVDITGVKTPFTLAAGASRDLAWLLDPADMTNYRWF